MAMYWSGAATGMELTAEVRKPTHKALPWALTVCAEAVAGMTVLGLAGRLAATTTLPSTAATSWASASFPPSNGAKAIHPFKQNELCQKGVRNERPKGKVNK